MVLYVEDSVEKEFRDHVISKGYCHGDLSKKATEAIRFYLDHCEE